MKVLISALACKVWLRICVPTHDSGSARSAEWAASFVQINLVLNILNIAVRWKMLPGAQGLTGHSSFQCFQYTSVQYLDKGSALALHNLEPFVGQPKWWQQSLTPWMSKLEAKREVSNLPPMAVRSSLMAIWLSIVALTKNKMRRTWKKAIPNQISKIPIRNNTVAACVILKRLSSRLWKKMALDVHPPMHRPIETIRNDITLKLVSKRFEPTELGEIVNADCQFFPRHQICVVQPGNGRQKLDGVEKLEKNSSGRSLTILQTFWKKWPKLSLKWKKSKSGWTSWLWLSRSRGSPMVIKLGRLASYMPAAIFPDCRLQAIVRKSAWPAHSVRKGRINRA